MKLKKTKWKDTKIGNREIEIHKQAEERVKSVRVIQLSANRIIHETEIKKIDQELAQLLRDDITSIEY